MKRLDKSEKTVVVFDGYSCPSTKDHEHQRRSKGKKTCNNIEVNSSKQLLVPKERFLSNNLNKDSFLNLLANTLVVAGICVRQAVEDADTLVVKAALESTASGTVNVYADDTDIFIVLLHHISSAKNTIYLTAVGKKHNMQKFSETLSPKQAQSLLVAYSFTGCDTVSSIFRVSKVKSFQKMSGVHSPENLIQVFLDKRSSVDDIKSAGVKLFEFLYQNPNSKWRLTLQELRYHKFMRMAARGVISPKDLPPSVGAAEQHALRAYIQVSDWVALTTKSLDPELFG